MSIQHPIFYRLNPFLRCFLLFPLALCCLPTTKCCTCVITLQETLHRDLPVTLHKQNKTKTEKFMLPDSAMKELLRVWVLFWPDLQRHCNKIDKTPSGNELSLELAACPWGRRAMSCLSIAPENPSQQSHKQWSETTAGRDDDGWARALKSMGGLAGVLIRPGFQPVSFGLLAAHLERGQPQEERGWPAGRGSSWISPQQQLPFPWHSRSDEPHTSAQRELW